MRFFGMKRRKKKTLKSKSLDEDSNLSQSTSCNGNSSVTDGQVLLTKEFTVENVDVNKRINIIAANHLKTSAYSLEQDFKDNIHSFDENPDDVYSFKDASSQTPPASSEIATKTASKVHNKKTETENYKNRNTQTAKKDFSIVYNEQENLNSSECTELTTENQNKFLQENTNFQNEEYRELNSDDKNGSIRINTETNTHNLPQNISNDNINSNLELNSYNNKRDNPENSIDFLFSDLDIPKNEADYMAFLSSTSIKNIVNEFEYLKVPFKKFIMGLGFLNSKQTSNLLALCTLIKNIDFEEIIAITREKDRNLRSISTNLCLNQIKYLIKTNFSSLKKGFRTIKDTDSTNIKNHLIKVDHKEDKDKLFKSKNNKENTGNSKKTRISHSQDSDEKCDDSSDDLFRNINMKLSKKQKSFLLQINHLYTEVFLPRYRDTDPTIRSLCINYISDYITQSPLFQTDTNIKYLVYSLLDKSEQVRKKSLKNMLRILKRNIITTQNFKNSKILVENIVTICNSDGNLKNLGVECLFQLVILKMVNKKGLLRIVNLLKEDEVQKLFDIFAIDGFFNAVVSFYVMHKELLESIKVDESKIRQFLKLINQIHAKEFSDSQKEQSDAKNIQKNCHNDSFVHSKPNPFDDNNLATSKAADDFAKNNHASYDGKIDITSMNESLNSSNKNNKFRNYMNNSKSSSVHNKENNPENISIDTKNTLSKIEQCTEILSLITRNDHKIAKQLLDMLVNYKENIIVTRNISKALLKIDLDYFDAKTDDILTVLQDNFMFNKYYFSVLKKFESVVPTKIEYLLSTFVDQISEKLSSHDLLSYDEMLANLINTREENNKELTEDTTIENAALDHIGYEKDRQSILESGHSNNNHTQKLYSIEKSFYESITECIRNFDISDHINRKHPLESKILACFWKITANNHFYINTIQMKLYSLENLRTAAIYILYINENISTQSNDPVLDAESALLSLKNILIDNVNAFMEASVIHKISTNKNQNANTESNPANQNTAEYPNNQSIDSISDASILDRNKTTPRIDVKKLIQQRKKPNQQYQKQMLQIISQYAEISHIVDKHLHLIFYLDIKKISEAYRLLQNNSIFINAFFTFLQKHSEYNLTFVKRNELKETTLFIVNKISKNKDKIYSIQIMHWIRRLIRDLNLYDNCFIYFLRCLTKDDMLVLDSNIGGKSLFKRGLAKEGLFNEIGNEDEVVRI